MNTIHHVMLPPTRGTHTVDVPYGSRILSATNQHEQLIVWFCYDEAVLDIVKCTVKVVFTGEQFVLVENDRFINTVSFSNPALGSYVLHVFSNGCREFAMIEFKIKTDAGAIMCAKALWAWHRSSLAKVQDDRQRGESDEAFEKRTKIYVEFHKAMISILEQDANWFRKSRVVRKRARSGK